MTKKIDYITFLSVVSAISVVFLHTNGCFWSFSKEKYWFTANIIECLFYFAVPIFFMISGATLIDYQERYSTKNFLKKRFFKTFIPFIAWSLIGMIYLIVYLKTISINDIGIKYIFNRTFNTSFINIYWFFIPLFCVYLCIPFFAIIEKNKRKNAFSFLAIMCFGVNCLIPFLIKIFKLDLAFPFSIAIGSGYLLYVLVGYLLCNYEITNKQKYIIYVLSIMGLLMHIIGIYKLSMDAGRIIDTYKGYNNVPCILYSVGVFIFLKDIGKKIKNYKIIKIISQYTFAIYLTHWYFLNFLSEQFNLPSKSIFYRLGLPFIIVPLCILCTYLIRKIPVVKKIVP